MDFLPRYFTSCALVGALCLAFSAPAFAVSPPSLSVVENPNFSWALSSGNAYRVYDSPGVRASSTFTPTSTFAEGDSAGVIESLGPPPFKLVGASGDVVTDLSRSLSVGDLVDGLGKLFSLDNPVGLAVLAATTLGPLALDIYDNYEDSQPSSGSFCSVTSPSNFSDDLYQINVANCSGSSPTAFVGEFYSLPAPSFIGCGVSSVSVSPVFGDVFAIAHGSSCPSGSAPSAGTVPTDLPLWIDDNWNDDDLATDASKALVDNPSDSPELATELADENAPLPSPVPYTYNPTSDSLSESPTTTTSTDPSTDATTTTETTPSFDATPAPDGGLDVTKDETSVTSSCTSAGSCTVTNNTTKSTTPKTASPFVSPSTTLPTASTSSVQSFALSLVVPSQSVAVCPLPLSFTALSNSFTIPLTPLCNLATDVNPYVESLGAVGAGIVIFR